MDRNEQAFCPARGQNPFWNVKFAPNGSASPSHAWPTVSHTVDCSSAGAACLVLYIAILLWAEIVPPKVGAGRVVALQHHQWLTVLAVAQKSARPTA